MRKEMTGWTIENDECSCVVRLLLQLKWFLDVSTAHGCVEMRSVKAEEF